MTPLDLSNRPPRGPRVLLGGYPMLARTIDRARASLPGGNRGRFVPVSTGLSAIFLKAIDVDPDALVAAVAGAKHEDDVVAWLETRAGRAKIAAAAARVAAIHVSDVLATEHRAEIEALYPADLLQSCGTCFDLLEADDRRMFGNAETAPARAPSSCSRGRGAFSASSDR